MKNEYKMQINIMKILFFFLIWIFSSLALWASELSVLHEISAKIPGEQESTEGRQIKICGAYFQGHQLWAASQEILKANFN